MSVDNLAIQLALRNRMLTLGNTLPAERAWENIQFEPTSGVPYIEEDFVPATVTLRGLVKGGTVESTGLYVIRWYGLSNAGLDMSQDVDALLDLFTPGTALPLGNGDVVRIRGDIAPRRGQLTQDTAGFAVIVVTIPWVVLTQNPA